MSKEMFFFATKADLMPGILSIEAKRQLTYTLTGSYSSTNFKTYTSFVDYENFGIKAIGNHQSESFLVLDASTKMNIWERVIKSGETRYFIDQMLNKTSIVFWQGGLYDNRFLICGHIATISDDLQSVELYKQFTKELVKGFKKVKRYYIGSEALELSKSVRLITMGINQPEIFDLKIE